MRRIKSWELFESDGSQLIDKLPDDIKTVEDVEKFLLTLALEGKMFHFDDDPHDVSIFTKEEADLVERLMDESFIVCEKHYKEAGKQYKKVRDAGFWEGMVKGVYGIGYLAFGACEPTDMEGKVYVVYGDGEDIRETTLGELRKKDDAEMEEFEKWFKELPKVKK